MNTTPSPLNVFGLSWLAAAFLAGGCKGLTSAQYVSPRIEGRVLDSDSHQPIKDVHVRRVGSGNSSGVSDTPKGATRMEATPAVRTEADGRFVLDSERDIAVFGSVGWYSVTISFKHPAYEDLTETYTLDSATNNASGEPVVKAGDILLRKVP
jgi:hypothetical protein